MTPTTLRVEGPNGTLTATSRRARIGDECEAGGHFVRPGSTLYADDADVLACLPHLLEQVELVMEVNE